MSLFIFFLLSCPDNEKIIQPKKINNEFNLFYSKNCIQTIINKYEKRNKQYSRKSQKAVQQNLFTLDLHTYLRVDSIYIKILSNSTNIRHNNAGGYNQLLDTNTTATQNEKGNWRGWFNDI